MKEKISKFNEQLILYLTNLINRSDHLQRHYILDIYNKFN